MSATRTKETALPDVEVFVTSKRMSFENADAFLAVKWRMMPSLSEFIFSIKSPDSEITPIEGKYWVRDESGPGFSGRAKIDYEKGRLEGVSASEYELLPDDQKAYVLESGSGHMCLYINLGNRTADGEEDASRLSLMRADADNTALVAYVLVNMEGEKAINDVLGPIERK